MTYEGCVCLEASLVFPGLLFSNSCVKPTAMGIILWMVRPPECLSSPVPAGAAPRAFSVRSVAVVLPQPESFKDTSDVRNDRERRNAPLTHLLQGNPGEETRLIFGTSSTLAFLLRG